MSEMVPARPQTAVILAGGLGTRLRAAVSDRPKALAPAGGQPFLAYLLGYLAGQGIRRAILATGYLAGQIEEYLQANPPQRLEVEIVREDSPLGTGGALRLAAGRLDRPFFALNGDTLFLADLQALWLGHVHSQCLGTLALCRASDSYARGCVQLDPGGKIVAFDEKPERAGLAPVLISAGMYVLEPSAIAGLAENQPASLEREVFPGLAAAGQLSGQEQAAYFIDIGSPASLAVFEHDLLAETIRIEKA